MGGCCGRLVAELKAPTFAVREPSDPRKEVDVVATFQTTSSFTKVIKAVLALLALACFIESLITTTRPQFMWAYLSHWSLTFATIYLCLSAVWIVVTPSETSPLVLLTWAMYPLVSVAEIIVCVLYWTLDYEPSRQIKIYTIAAHGFIMLLVLIDGILISRVPVRVRQLVFPFVYFSVYILWTGVHALLDIGNKHRNEGVDDDDAIYAMLSWNHKLVPTLIICLGVLFVACPVVFFLIWGLSICGRKFKTSDIETDAQYDDEENKQYNKGDEMQPASLF